MDIEDLKHKYADDKLRLALKYFQAGIPEVYWFREPDKKQAEQARELSCLLDDFGWVVLTSYNTLVSQDCLAYTMKNYQDAKVFDFTDVAFHLCDLYKTRDLMVSSYDIIGVLHVRPSQVFDRACDSFVQWITRLSSSVKRKRIVVCLERREDMSVYKTLATYLMSKHFRVMEVSR